MATVFNRTVTALTALAISTAATAAPVVAQSGSVDPSAFRSRAALDSIANALQRSGKSAEAAAVRDRLKVGDFYPGDRLVIELYGGEEPFRDTVAVRNNQEIVVQSFPAFSLRGVLRAEADSVVLAQMKRYIQRPTVRTQALTRLLVTGAVGRPGFVTVRSDAAVAEVVSTAGGLIGVSRLDKSKIRRGTETLADADSLNLIFRTGMTVDQADLRAGDEIVIAERKPSNITQILWSASAALGVVISIISLTRR